MLHAASLPKAVCHIVQALGEAGLVDALYDVGLTALGGPAESGTSWDWAGGEDPVLGLNSGMRLWSDTYGCIA